jgi:hypothetical protein
MGKRDLDLMRQGAMDREGETLTRVGYILGIITTILTAVSLVLVCVIFGLMGLFAGGRAGG